MSVQASATRRELLKTMGAAVAAAALGACNRIDADGARTYPRPLSRTIG